MNRLTRTLLACLCALLLLPAMSRAQGAAAQQTRRWRVMVIVPEQHLARPRIPDPAAETELCRQLIDAGYKVIDPSRYRELRYQAVMDRILKGGPNAKKEAAELGRRFGADIFVYGEAFSEEDLRRQIATDIGTVTRIQCRARAEIKALRVDTAEIIFSDDAHRTGPPEAGESLSSKAALRDAAEVIGPKLLTKLDKLALGGGQNIELHVRGIASAALADELETVLAKLPGVLDVAPGDYDARTYTTELRLSKAAVRGLAGLLETSPALKRFKLAVQSASGSKIIVNCK